MFSSMHAIYIHISWQMYVLIIWLTLKAELRPHICTLHLNTCKRDCHQKQWEKIGLTAFNMNANHEHQHNTRKHTKKTTMPEVLEKSPWKKKFKSEKAPRKPKKREQSPDKKLAWGILSEPLVFCLVFSKVVLVDQDTSTGILCAKNILKSRTVPDTLSQHHSTEITRSYISYHFLKK